MSFHKCPCVLIHCTASILLSVIQFRKFHHIQIIKTASILHLQWAMMSMCTRMCTLLVLLGQIHESVNYCYSELSYESAKLYRSSVDWWLYRAWFVEVLGTQLILCIACTEYATDIELHVHTYAVGVADTAAREGLPHNVLHSSSYVNLVWQCYNHVYTITWSHLQCPLLLLTV